MCQPDKTFYSRLLQGYPAAFEEILRWYADDVIRLATFILNDPDEARDILQETMLKFVESVKKKRVHGNNGSIKSLIITIAKNLCINRLKKNQRFVEFPDGNLDNLPDLIDPQTPRISAREMEFEEAFQEALGQLSPLQRTVLVLHELQQDSFQEIAQALGLSYECVKKNFYRGLKKMRVLLEPFDR